MIVDILLGFFLDKILSKVTMALRVAIRHMFAQTRLPCLEDGYFSACVLNGCCMQNCNGDTCGDCDGCYARHEASQIREQPFTVALVQLSACSRDFLELVENDQP